MQLRVKTQSKDYMPNIGAGVQQVFRLAGFTRKEIAVFKPLLANLAEKFG